MKDFDEKNCCSSSDDSCGCVDQGSESDDSCSCDDEFMGCSCGCGDDEGEYIKPENVAEIALDQNGTVHLLVVDDNGENPQEFAIDFPNIEEAEAWLRETFGDEIFEQDEEQTR